MWNVGQRVECGSLDWGPCYVTMSSEQLVVVYCPRYEIVTTGNQAQLERAGWKMAEPDNVVWMGQHRRSDRPSKRRSIQAQR